MNEILSTYPEAKCNEIEAVSENMSQRLERKAIRLRSQLDEVENAIKAMNENPEVARVFDLVMKANRF